MAFKLRELAGISLDRPSPTTVAWPATHPLSSQDVEFERRVTDLQHDRQLDVDRLRAAIDLSGGPFLPGSELPWVVERRTFLSVLYEESVLLDQPFVEDPAKTVNELLTEKIAKTGERITIRRFTRYKMGEGLAKRGDDFGGEVAALAGGNQ